MHEHDRSAKICRIKYRWLVKLPEKEKNAFTPRIDAVMDLVFQLTDQIFFEIPAIIANDADIWRLVNKWRVVGIISDTTGADNKDHCGKCNQRVDSNKRSCRKVEHNDKAGLC